MIFVVVFIVNIFIDKFDNFKFVNIDVQCGKCYNFVLVVLIQGIIYLKKLFDFYVVIFCLFFCFIYVYIKELS